MQARKSGDVFISVDQVLGVLIEEQALRDMLLVLMSRQN